MRQVKSSSEIRFDSNTLLLARLRAGLTQEGLARKLDISTRQVQRWEAGESVPSGESLLQIAGELGVSTSELYVREEAAA